MKEVVLYQEEMDWEAEKVVVVGIAQVMVVVPH
jgi:hypothetical protein